MKKAKKTIFLNTHNLDEAQRICDRIGILKTKLMALGTPWSASTTFAAQLEQSASGRKTVIELRAINDAILDALKKLTLGKMTRDDNRLTIDVVNPKEENPAIVRAIVEAGGDVESLSVLSSTLEDIYLKLVRESQ